MTLTSRARHALCYAVVDRATSLVERVSHLGVLLPDCAVGDASTGIFLEVVDPPAGLRFGCIVVSEIETPNMLANTA